jgi:hypothetical protein
MDHSQVFFLALGAWVFVSLWLCVTVVRRPLVMASAVLAIVGLTFGGLATYDSLRGTPRDGGLTEGSMVLTGYVVEPTDIFLLVVEPDRADGEPPVYVRIPWTRDEAEALSQASNGFAFDGQPVMVTTRGDDDDSSGGQEYDFINLPLADKTDE